MSEKAWSVKDTNRGTREKVWHERESVVRVRKRGGSEKAW